MFPRLIILYLRAFFSLLQAEEKEKTSNPAFLSSFEYIFRRTRKTLSLRYCHERYFYGLILLRFHTTVKTILSKEIPYEFRTRSFVRGKFCLIILQFQLLEIDR